MMHRHTIFAVTNLQGAHFLHSLTSAHPHIHTQSKLPRNHTQCFMFPLTSRCFSFPTFIVEVLPALARLPFDGWPAVDHVDTPLHFHVLLAFLEGLDEKLPIISPD